MGTAFSAELNGDGFFRWVGWGRLFQMGWGRLFQMGWLGTAFSDGLAGDGFFRWVGDGFFRWIGWGRLFHMSWLRTAFSKLYTLSHQLFLLTHLRSEVVNRLVLHTDLSVFRNPSHTSHTDPRPHVTALLATSEQDAQNKSQVVHIYHDENGKYTGHSLYPERENKKED
jgi:hypothetical protein